MTVEKLKENSDNFPVGMRVLAVDDDPICLKLLDTLLRKCQYHVTTTSQARMALKMLRETRERFDLVISDVHMPDMDGFKLLELVGLEMDLPVIMLSANSDPKLVMKGVTHGACDYLVKPIRIEELRNIWQHVIRKKKFVPKKPNNDQVKANNNNQANGEGGRASPTTDNGDQNGKTNRKRKEEEDDQSEDGNESEENGTQKRPRVVWSIELHRKFVASVNQLGIEKAVPKRILDLMNVEGLTRENVASHLQKYRLYLKRISSVATQQANMAAALGVKDSSFMRIGPFEGLGDFRTLSGPGRQLANAALSHYTAGGMLGRLNTPANVNLQNLSPTAFIQPGQHIGKMLFNQNPNLFQGMPSSFELDHFQQQNNKVSLKFTDQGAMGGPSNTTMSLHGNYQQSMSNGVFGNQLSSNLASFSSDSFNIDSSAMQPITLLSSSSQPFHSQLPLPLDNTRQMPFREDYGVVGHSLERDKSGILFKEKGDAVNGRVGEGGDSTESRGRAEDSFLLEQPKSQGGFASRGYDSFDDMVMNSMIKREHDETIPSCDFGLQSYSFGQGGT